MSPFGPPRVAATPEGAAVELALLARGRPREAAFGVAGREACDPRACVSGAATCEVPDAVGRGERRAARARVAGDAAVWLID